MIKNLDNYTLIGIDLASPEKQAEWDESLKVVNAEIMLARVEHHEAIRIQRVKAWARLKDLILNDRIRI